jgi:DNA primase catalytic subunit
MQPPEKEDSEGLDSLEICPLPMPISKEVMIDAMRIYYLEYFPYSLIFDLFKTRNPNREFPIWIKLQGKPEPFPNRKRVHESAENFRAYVREKCITSTSYVTQIDVGPVKNKLGRPITNSLKFDFDAKDFQRTCSCGEKDCCSLCFSLLVAHLKLLVKILKVEFGIEAILTVFSGGRGIHLWVIHSEFEYSREFKESVCERLKVTYSIPIDKGVTVGDDHMLKSPFSVHPRTGRICFPYTIAEMSSPDFLKEAYTLDTITHNIIEEREKMIREFFLTKS